MALIWKFYNAACTATSNFDKYHYIRCLRAEFTAKHGKAPLSLTTRWWMEPDLGSWQTPDISRSHLYRGTIAWTPPTTIYREYTVFPQNEDVPQGNTAPTSSVELEVAIVVTTAHLHCAGGSSRWLAVLLIAGLCFPDGNSFPLSRYVCVCIKIWIDLIAISKCAHSLARSLARSVY